jgi:hypothetical protein
MPLPDRYNDRIPKPAPNPVASKLFDWWPGANRRMANQKKITMII